MDNYSRIRILVVEDSPIKRTDVEAKLDAFSFSQSLVEMEKRFASNLVEALQIYESDQFDIVVLDLLIPASEEESVPRFENAQIFYDTVKKSKRPKPFLVVGLTAKHKDEYIDAFKGDPTFEIVDYNEALWSEKIKQRIDFVVSAKKALRRFVDNSYDMDALIIVARKLNEYDPIVKSISWLPGSSRPSERVSRHENMFGKIELSSGQLFELGIVCLGEMGLSTSAAIATQLVHQFRPKYLVMLGMCCGFKEGGRGLSSSLGDVIIARQTVNWDEGKYKDGDKNLVSDAFFHNRALEKMPSGDFVDAIKRVLEASGPDIAGRVRKYYETFDVRDIRKKVGSFNPKKTEIHFNTLVSGSSVIDSATMISEIQKRFPQACGLEMEAHSIYSAARCISGAVPEVVVIKGVADYGDGKKKKAIQPLASTASWIVFREIIEGLFGNKYAVRFVRD